MPFPLLLHSILLKYFFLPYQIQSDSHTFCLRISFPPLPFLLSLDLKYLPLSHSWIPCLSFISHSHHLSNQYYRMGRIRYLFLFLFPLISSSIHDSLPQCSDLMYIQGEVSSLRRSSWFGKNRGKFLYWNGCSFLKHVQYFYSCFQKIHQTSNQMQNGGIMLDHLPSPGIFPFVFLQSFLQSNNFLYNGITSNGLSWNSNGKNSSWSYLFVIPSCNFNQTTCPFIKSPSSSLENVSSRSDWLGGLIIVHFRV